MDSRRRKFYGWGYADEGAAPDEIRLLERTLDPKGMLNPGVLIDPDR